jgi:putative membrane protein
MQIVLYKSVRSSLTSLPAERDARMIKNFGDHAANERTFLAWVRTAIAVMAFGFLIEKFDLFLAFAAAQSTARAQPLHGQRFANEAGLAFIFLGVAMIAIAAVRFFRTARDIDREKTVAGAGARLDLALAGLLAILGVCLFLYMSAAVLPSL